LIGTNDINEIKLGQNASFIFAVCEYLKYGQFNKRYLNVAQQVAQGMLKMINQTTGETVHILNYPDLTVKENIVLYIMMEKQHLRYYGYIKSISSRNG